jgi:hypothetical protein
MEHFDLRVASIDDVIAKAAYQSSGRAWHTSIYPSPCLSAKRKEECPLFLLLDTSIPFNFKARYPHVFPLSSITSPMILVRQVWRVSNIKKWIQAEKGDKSNCPYR